MSLAESPRPTSTGPAVTAGAGSTGADPSAGGPSVGASGARPSAWDRPGVRLTAGAALARNTLKILLPWQAGHVTAIAAMWGGFEDGDPVAYTSSIVVYVLITAYAVMCLRGSGRGPHDLLAGSVVRPVGAPATPSPPR